MGVKHTIDEYYYDPKRKTLKPDKFGELSHYLRLRKKNYVTDEEVSVIDIKNDIQKFINDLKINVSKELNMGKPEMYMRNHNIKID